MATWLLTWNPKHNSDLAEDYEKVRFESSNRSRWSCGNNRQITKDDRIYMMRQGPKAPGIVGYGTVTRGSFEDRAWRSGGRATSRYVEFDWEYLVDPESDVIVPRDELRRPPFDIVHWDTQASGISIADPVAAALRKRTLVHGTQADVGSDAAAVSGVEGKVTWLLVRHRKREARLRAAKIADALARNGGRLICEIPGCGFDFKETYGALGDGYAHVHHLELLSAKEEPTRITLKQLAIVCANCHAMIHKDGACRPLRSIRVRRRRT